MNPYLSLLIGVGCAGVGGDLFVRGSVGLARWAHVSTAIIGVTVAAFATSSPELSVAIGSALAKKPEISLGDVTGSNVFNIAFILGAALCISGFRASRSSTGRDFPMALVVPIVLGVLGWDGVLSQVDGAILISLFTAWLWSTVAAARRERSVASKGLKTHEIGEALLQTHFGLIFLIGSGHFIVSGARGIALAFGIPEFVIGATVVAAGTSMPELATTIVSKIRGHDDIGLGTVWGSNIFNGFFIVGVAAITCPIRMTDSAVGVALGFGLLTTALTFPKGEMIGRGRGVILLVIYGLYLAVVLRK
jgi:cation:H+ antiporter